MTGEEAGCLAKRRKAPGRQLGDKVDMKKSVGIFKVQRKEMG